MKTCSRCKVAKPECEFSPRADRPGKTQPACRGCLTAAARLWRDLRGDAYLSYKRERYRANPDKERQRCSAWSKANPAKANAMTAARKAALLRAQPRWADRADIAMWYEVAEVLSRSGVKFQVDHTVPLRSPLVCGLHASANLNVLPAHINAAKGNRHWPDMP